MTFSLGHLSLPEDNLALVKKASQSSTRTFNRVSTGAQKAVDGSVTDCAATDREQQPWWQVDLAGYYRVSRVRVTNLYYVPLGNLMFTFA